MFNGQEIMSSEVKTVSGTCHVKVDTMIPDYFIPTELSFFSAMSSKEFDYLATVGTNA
jgi:hypothetical protein